jgi:hypothetical protein
MTMGNEAISRALIDRLHTLARALLLPPLLLPAYKDGMRASEKESFGGSSKHMFCNALEIALGLIRVQHFTSSEILVKPLFVFFLKKAPISLIQLSSLPQFKSSKSNIMLSRVHTLFLRKKKQFRGNSPKMTLEHIQSPHNLLVV